MAPHRGGGWRGLVVLLALAAALWFRTPSHALLKTSSSLGDCHVISGLATLSVEKAQSGCEHFHTNESNQTRFVTSNHKTGTDFSDCVCRVLLRNHGVPCKTTYFHHTSGQGLTSNHFCVNMIRDVFEMVYSGMQVRCVVWYDAV